MMYSKKGWYALTLRTPCIHRNLEQKTRLKQSNHILETAAALMSIFVPHTTRPDHLINLKRSTNRAPTSFHRTDGLPATSSPDLSDIHEKPGRHHLDCLSSFSSSESISKKLRSEGSCEGPERI